MAIDTAGNHKHLENTKEMLDYAYIKTSKVVMLTRKLNGIKKKCLLDLCLINLKWDGRCC
jgi:hypothetical protein